MSQEEHQRIFNAAARLHEREGGQFSAAALARAAAMSRATLYRRIRADFQLRNRIAALRKDGVRSSRDTLVQAASELLAQDGLSSLTLESVALRAGLSTATLYRHFENRDALLRAVVQTLKPAQAIFDRLNADGPLEQVLERAIEVILANLRERPHMLRFLLTGAVDDIRAVQSLRRSDERLSLALVTLFAKPEHRQRLRNTPTESLAASMLGLIFASSIFPRVGSETTPFTPAQLVEQFLYGALTTTPPNAKKAK